MASLNDIETKIESIIDKLSIKTIIGVLPLTFTAKGGTAADWEIRGNDEPGTENLFDGSFAQGYYSTNNGTVQPSTRYSLSSKTAVAANATYTYSFSCDSQSGSDGFISFWNGETYLSWVAASSHNVATFTTPANATHCAITIGGGAGGTVLPSDISNIMLIKGSTAPDHYIPYQQGVGEQRVDGYYVPLTISQQGQPDKTVDIYIGDSPLTEGETVSKTSTGVDIELFEGENTISTTLYNNPKIKIYYKWR